MTIQNTEKGLCVLIGTLLFAGWGVALLQLFS